MHNLAQGYIANKISFIIMANEFISDDDDLLFIPHDVEFFEMLVRSIDSDIIKNIPSCILIMNKINRYFW